MNYFNMPRKTEDPSTFVIEINIIFTALVARLNDEFSSRISLLSFLLKSDFYVNKKYSKSSLIPEFSRDTFFGAIFKIVFITLVDEKMSLPKLVSRRHPSYINPLFHLDCIVIGDYELFWRWMTLVDLEWICRVVGVMSSAVCEGSALFILRVNLVCRVDGYLLKDVTCAANTSALELASSSLQTFSLSPDLDFTYEFT
jgi:hypothetical protein